MLGPAATAVLGHWQPAWEVPVDPWAWAVARGPVNQAGPAVARNCHVRSQRDACAISPHKRHDSSTLASMYGNGMPDLPLSFAGKAVTPAVATVCLTPHPPIAA